MIAFALGAAWAAVTSCGSSDAGITVTNPKVAALKFGALPGTVVAGQPFSVSVELVTATGERVTTATDMVTIALTGGGPIGGTTSVAAVAGLATFAGLSVAVPAANLQLTAAGAGFTVTSAAFVASDPCTPLTLAFPGTAGGALASSGCIGAGLPSVYYRFSTIGTGGTTFSISGAFPARIEVMTDPPGSNFALQSAATPSSVTGEWLLPAGTYQLRATAVSGGGTFTLSGTSTQGTVNNGSGCTAAVPLRVLVVSGVYAGQSLGTGDCTIAGGGHADFFYVRSLNACTITMSPTGFDAYLDVRDAATGGDIVTTNTGGVGVPETLSLAACSTAGAAVAIVAKAYEPGDAGTYSITITISGGSSGVR
jgi:hypothetical protein